MAFHDELLDQADHLLTGPVSPGGPSDADVRRAISNSYYALFHLLVEEATALLCPPQPPQLAAQFRRAFAHRDMRDICAQVAKGTVANMSAPLKQLLSDPVATELRRAGEKFVSLQEERYRADYDLQASIPLLTAQAAVQDAKTALAAWQSVRGSDNAHAFLAALLLNKRLGGH